MSNINGSYKLSEYLLKCLTSKTINFKSSSCSGASSYEIDAVIYFAQICDASGYIPSFKISELKDVIGCSLRECYQILSSLSDKNIITVSCYSKNGYRDITLKNNDFINVKNWRKSRYVNLNREFLNPYSPDYIHWQTLSLYAKRLLLLILFNYSPKNGYRFKFKRIAKSLGIKKESLISEYLKEIKPLMEEVAVFSSKNNLSKSPDMCFVKRNNTFLVPNSGLSAFQPSNLRYHLDLCLKKMTETGVTFTNKHGYQIKYNSYVERKAYIASLSTQFISLVNGCDKLSLSSIINHFYDYVSERDTITHYHILDFIAGMVKYNSFIGPLPAGYDLYQFYDRA